MDVTSRRGGWRWMVRIVAVAALGLAAAGAARAEVRVTPLFGDHMVLQRERPVPVWGWADPGEEVEVRFGEQAARTRAGADGRWMTFLAPMPASTAPRELTIRGNNELRFKDVLVGDVWLGSGQSNMDWSVSGTDGAERVKKAPPGAYDGIRMFKVDECGADRPADTLSGRWRLPTEANIRGFSATLFFFAEELKPRQPDVPLGLIRASVGATNLYSWIPNELFAQDPSAEYLRGWWQRATRSWTQEKQDEYEKARKAYEDQVAELRRNNQPIPQTLKKPGEVMGPKWSRRPTAFYNGMIAPVMPFAIRGAVWYQGEWDGKHDWVQVYHGMFVAMADAWRTAWGRAAGKDAPASFPLYVVQLPSREPNDGRFWPFMREVQENLSRDVPDSGLVVIYDLNDGSDLHPREKTGVGQRLARLALAKEYGRDTAWRGPVMKTCSAAGDTMTVTFDSGAKSLKSSDGQPLRNFQLAGADGVYRDAKAELDGDRVRLTADGVPEPKAVRFAWMPTPERPNFYNDEDLPAWPFRTDAEKPVRP